MVVACCYGAGNWKGLGLFVCLFVFLTLTVVNLCAEFFVEEEDDGFAAGWFDVHSQGRLFEHWRTELRNRSLPSPCTALAATKMAYISSAVHMSSGWNNNVVSNELNWGPDSLPSTPSAANACLPSFTLTGSFALVCWKSPWWLLPWAPLQWTAWPTLWVKALLSTQRRCWAVELGQSHFTNLRFVDHESRSPLS